MMRSLKWMSLALLLAACGGEPDTGEQRSAELPNEALPASGDAAAPETGAAAGDAGEEDTGLTDPGMPDSRDWQTVEMFIDMLQVEGLERSGSFGGSTSAAVRERDGQYALVDRNDTVQTVLVWTLGGVTTPTGRFVFEFDLDDVSPHSGWILVTLSYRAADGNYNRVHCAYSPDLDETFYGPDNGEGSVAIEGNTGRCTLEPVLAAGDLDVYIYPAAYRPDIGQADQFVGEIVVSKLRLNAGG